jgi:glutamyl-tRNA reductase
VKDAYDVAREAGTVGPVLNRVVPRALKAAKRVRSETAIGSGQVSVPSVAVDLARQIFGDLSQHTAALLGSGEMGETVLKLLHQAGARLIVIGRNAARVNELALAMDAEPRLLPGDLERTLTDADVVVTATSSADSLVNEGQVRAVRKARRGRNLFFIDLAVPRDVDPAVGTLDGVFLYNVDDLSKIVAASLAERRKESERGEGIVLEEAQSYDRWAEAEQVTPTIVQLREKLSGILGVEMDRSLSGKLKHLGPEDKEALRIMVEAALNKMLHPVTARLRGLAADPSAREELGDAVGWLTELFELEPGKARAVDARETAPGDAADEASGPAARGRGGVREAS